jgi:hypothetical protein
MLISSQGLPNPRKGPFEKLESGKQEIEIYLPVFRSDQGQQLVTGEKDSSDRVQ